MVAAICAQLISWGTSSDAMPWLSVNRLPRAARAEGARVRAVAALLWRLATRPTCISCSTWLAPPLARTAVVTWRQASIWRGVAMPGVRQ
ncbi:hypothetical protein D3C84_927070 [compost metagenome]